MTDSLSFHLIIIMQHDLEKAIAFYERLGFPLLFHVPDRWAEFNVQGVKLGLAKADKELPERRTGIVLQAPDVHSLYERLRKEGVEFVHTPIEEAHGIMASFRDPGNNVVDLYQPTPEKMRESFESQKAQG